MKKELTQQQFQELYNQFLSMLEEKEQPTKKRPRKRPHGSGTINFLGKGRRKPYQPIVTLGYDEETGKQIRKALPTCETKKEAQEALDLYNLLNKGYVTEGQLAKTEEKWMPTFKEIYERAIKEKEHSVSHATIKKYNQGFSILKKIHDIKMNKIDLNVLQPLFDSLRHYSESILASVKNTLNLCFKYAMKYDYIEKNYCEFLEIRFYKKQEKKHKALSKEEIKRIYELSKTDDIAKLILVYIYTGLRAMEYVELAIKNIFLEEGYFIGGKKTKAGKNRTVPIHHSIKDFIVASKPKTTSYYALACKLNNFNEKYNTNYTFHDFRHTFATLCVEYGLNDYYAKCILGHSHKDLTKDVYTHATIEKLKEEIEKIPHPKDL